jgi:hypothetical protein
VDLLERTRALIDTWNESGPDAIGDFARHDVVLVEREDVLERDTIMGKAAVLDRFRDRLALVGPSRASLRSVDYLADGRVVADMDLHFEGRVSGIEGDFQTVHVYTWDGDVLARIEEFPNIVSARGLTGAWRLVEWTAGDSHPLGPDAVGRLIYSDDGFMAAFLARSDGWSDGLAYSGAWELRGREEVVHHVSVATQESFAGRDLVRFVSWIDDDLVLTTPRPRGGEVNVLRWRREGG